MNRITHLRQDMVDGKHGRYRMLLPVDWSTSQTEDSISERKALALKLVLEQMPIFIEERERIVGSRTVFGRRHANQTDIVDPSRDVSVFAYPGYLTEEERARFNTSGGSSKGHYVAGYRKVLDLGLGGIINEARQRLQDETNPQKRDFLSTVVIAYQGASVLIQRYATLARDMALRQPEPRRNELERIAEVCEHITLAPPKDFHEALQLFWFTHIVLMVENQCLMSFGRFDQHLEPFYSTCPETEAQELLECFLIKLNDQADIKQGEGFFGSDNLMLAGQKRDGSDATNRLTYACLNALDRLRLANPQFNVRLHQDSPTELLRRVSELSQQGCGQLSFYNDEAIIPSLVQAGFPIEDARDYALDACQDVLIEGKSDFYLGGSILLTPLLLDTLQEADDQVTFEQFVDTYRQRIRTATQQAAQGYIRSLSAPNVSPLPFLSGTLEDCIGKGLDVTQGGLRYRDKGMFVMSPVNAANSLAAIKQVVFTEHATTLSEIRDACQRNYEGQEALRQRLLAAPKWGNDDDRVDILAKDLFEFACREILTHRIDAEARFLSGIHQPHHVTTGSRIGATPDGRKAGEPIPVTLSPTNGSEHRGPTAVLKSVAKIDPMLCQWNSALTLNLHPTAVAGESGRKKFEILLRTFFALGGIQLQTNILDVEVLRQARNNPHEYRDLVIRVWGFSAYFVDLSRAYQDEVIARTAHVVG